MNNSNVYDEFLLVQKTENAINVINSMINKIKTEHPEDEVIYRDGFKPLDKLVELLNKVTNFRNKLISGTYRKQLDVVMSNLGGVDSPYYKKICSNDIQYLDYVYYVASSLYGNNNEYSYYGSDAETFIESYEKNQEDLMNGTIKKLDDDAKERIKNIDDEIAYLNYEKGKFFLFRHGSKKNINKKLNELTKEKNDLNDAINNRI